jgi:hypothetical protein
MIGTLQDRLIKELAKAGITVPKAGQVDFKPFRHGYLAGWRSVMREVGRKKDGNSHKAHAPIKSHHSATPFGIGRFVLGRAGKSRQLPHIKRRFYNAEKNRALCPTSNERSLSCRTIDSAERRYGVTSS